MSMNKAMSLKDAMKAYKERNDDNKDISSISISSKPKKQSNNNSNNNSSVSTMYYSPTFSLGEDVHSNVLQEEEWKNAVKDGRQHVSHREQAKLRAKEFKQAISQYDIIQFFIKELTYHNNDDNQSTYFTLLNLETIRIIIDYAYPGQGVLLTSDLMIYESIRDKENIHTCNDNNFPFRLCARKRPLQDFELKENAFDCIDTKNNSVCIHEGRLARNGRQLSMRHIQYTIDRVWDENVDNHKLCTEEIDPLVNYVFDGNNATVICFGQTGTGKTYTLMGAIEHLSSRFVGFSIAITFYEIAGKKCFDLMNQRKSLQVLSDDKEDIHVKGITTLKITAKNNNEIMNLLQEALKLRSSEETERNMLSSRSHAVCNIKLLDGDAVIGKLMLVDLAGSERNYETLKMTAQMHRESADINFSLMSLKDCFRAYHSNLTGNKYMQRTESRCNNPINDKVLARAPYRSSLLTRVLRECFILDASKNFHKTLLIATLSPSPNDVTHSINTLDHVSLMSPIFQSLTTSIIVEVPLLGAPLASAAIHTWTHDQLNVWLASADGGRFSSLALPPNIDGARLMEFDTEVLSSLFCGQLREARQEGEGIAWVEGIESTEKHHYLARALWSSLRRTNLHAQIAREKESQLPISLQQIMK